MTSLQPPPIKTIRPDGSILAPLRGLIALLRSFSLPFVRRHPGRALILVLAVALGVAAAVASGSLIDSAVSALESSWSGRGMPADLQIANGFAGVPEELVEQARDVEGVESATGLLMANVTLQLEDARVDLLLLGLDLLAGDRSLRDMLFSSEASWIDEMDFLTRIDAVALPRGFARAHGLDLGSTIDVEVQSERRHLYIAALIELPSASAFGGGVPMIMDLGAAQRLLGRDGLVQIVNVTIRLGSDRDVVRERLDARVADRGVVEAGQKESPQFRSLLSSIRLVLGVTGAIALVIGVFVIHHAVAMTTSKRKPEFDVVRSLGASRRAIAVLLCCEALVLGLLGTLAGILLGTGLAWAASGVFRHAIGLLYIPLASASRMISSRSIWWGIGIGLVVTWLAAVGPVLGGGRVAVGSVISSPSRERWRRARRLAWLGAASGLGGGVIGNLQRPGLAPEILSALSTIGDVLVLVGLGLVAPVAVLSVSPIASKLLRSRRAILARLAWQGISADPARGASVITSVMVGAAFVVISAGTVGSMRDGVLRWLRDTQRADLVVAGADSIGLAPASLRIPTGLEARIRAVRGVSAVEAVRFVAQPFGSRWVVVMERNPDSMGSRHPVRLIEGDLGAARESMRSGTGTVVSQHFAEQQGLSVGESVALRSPDGVVSLRIDAVVEDYSSADLGTVFISPQLWAQHWREGAATSYQIWLEEGESAENARERVALAIQDACNCSVLTQTEFRERAVAIVDTTFYTAYALELIAVVVMLVAVASFFLISIDERAREIDTLRSLGATRSQVVGSFLLEAAAIGILGGMLGAGSGVLLADRMVRKTIHAGAGMIFDFSVPWAAIAIGVGGAVAVSVAAAFVPTWWSIRWRAVPSEGES